MNRGIVVRSKSYYLVTPNDALYLREREFNSALWGYLKNPQLVESVASGKSSWSESDYYARAKYAFLINLYSERLTDEEVNLLFGHGRINLALFDKYWTIQYLEVGASTEDIEDLSIDKSHIELSGSELLDSWLSRKLM
jgi:hypothetical protein